MEQQFGTFTASELYCPKCKTAQPVRERLLLVLPTGELHEYLCSRCASSLGERTVTGGAIQPATVPSSRREHHAGRGRSGARVRALPGTPRRSG